MKSAHMSCTGRGDQVDEMPKRKRGSMYGPYEAMESGHWPMTSRPEELARKMHDLTRG
jgi:hypothetical protein